MCISCKEDNKLIERLTRNVKSCGCVDKPFKPRRKYYAEYYQRNRERKLAAANKRYESIKQIKPIKMEII